MTLISEKAAIRHQGNGSATTFPYDFVIPTADEVVVELVELATDEVTELNSSQYVVSGIGDPNGGEVEYPLSGPALTSDFEIVVSRAVDYIQPIVISNQGGFHPEVVEGQLDRTVMQTQDLKRDLARAPKMAEGAVGPRMPSPDEGKTLKWEGNRLVNSAGDVDGIVEAATAQANIATTQAGVATDAANAAEASESAASASASSAESAKDGAEAAQSAAETAASNASDSATSATASATSAATSESNADASATTAAASESAATTAASAAADSATAANTARDDAETARNEAETARDDAVDAASSVLNVDTEIPYLTMQDHEDDQAAPASGVRAYIKDGELFGRAPAGNPFTLGGGGSELGFVNVVEEGAAGDGSTDDRSALNTLVDTEGVGASFSFPPGTYLLNSDSFRPFSGDRVEFNPGTNLFDAPEDFADAGAWTLSAASIETNATAAPDGTGTADKLVESATSAVHQARQTVSVTLGQTYTFSVYAKAAERDRVFMVLPTALFGSTSCVFNLADGTAGFSNADVLIEDVGHGWFRCSMAREAVDSGSAAGDIRLHDGSSQTYAGDGSSGIYLWGAVMEVGSAPSDYFVIDQFGPRSDQVFKAANPWATILHRDTGDIDKIVRLNDASGVVFDGLQFTHEFPVYEYDATVQSQGIFCESSHSHYVQIRNSVFRDIAQQAIFNRGPGNFWKITGNYAVNMAREFFFSSNGTYGSIIGFNHIINAGDDGIALNGPTAYSAVVANFMDHTGRNHTHFSPFPGGGGSMKTHGHHNLISSNIFKDPGRWFWEIRHGEGVNHPDGNLFSGNICHGTQLHPDHANSFALFIIRPSDDALNVVRGNIITGVEHADCMMWRGNDFGSATGGEWYFVDNIVRKMRYPFSWTGSANGKRLIIKNNYFFGITGLAILRNLSSGSTHFDEIILEGNEFEFSPESDMDYIVRITQPGFTCDRLVLRRNRLLNDVTLAAIVSLAGGASITQIIDEDNDWTEA